ncbi:MAG: hydroxymethylglutaryl-CoA lyase [Planctomycetes bacterium]|nr:hydroxymethylglutaryl-CoA lyase [Planctomycetota bacterium]
MNQLFKKVKIVEVGPRDGLQNIKDSISTENKVRFVEMLADAGCTNIEITAFVHPKLIPQLADSGEVCAKLAVRPGVQYSVLVPNAKGMERAIEFGIKEIAVFTAASETFNMKNTNTTIDGSIERFREVVDMARKNNIAVRGYVSTVFGCPFEKQIAPEKVLEVTGKLFDLGIYEVSLGDTIGVAVPTDVERVLEKVLAKFDMAKIALHMHDTRGTALANVVKGREMGITVFDASAGGLGGCPFAPGAAGNLATEDIVYTFEKMGVSTGIDIEKLTQASRFMEGVLGRKLPSRYLSTK